MYHLNRDWFDAVRGIAVSPFNWLGVLIVETDVTHNFASQIGLGTEDTAGDEVALDFGEPEFDLVEPRGVSRRVMDAHARMFGQKGGHGLGLVRREVIDDE